jgi:hypothetical protein
MRESLPHLSPRDMHLSSTLSVSAWGVRPCRHKIPFTSSMVASPLVLLGLGL